MGVEEGLFATSDIHTCPFYLDDCYFAMLKDFSKIQSIRLKMWSEPARITEVIIKFN